MKLADHQEAELCAFRDPTTSQSQEHSNGEERVLAFRCEGAGMTKLEARMRQM
jgi:hypothetical protein